MDLKSIGLGLACVVLYSKPSVWKGLGLVIKDDNEKNIIEKLLPIDLLVFTMPVLKAVIASNAPFLFTLSMVSLLQKKKQRDISIILTLLFMRKVMRDYFLKKKFIAGLEELNIKHDAIGGLSISRLFQAFCFPMASYVENVLPFSDIKHVRGIVYNKEKPVVSKLDILFSTNKCKNIQEVDLFIYIHGGGWFSSYMDKFGVLHSLPLHMHMARKGAIVCSIDYGLAPHSNLETIVKDLKIALKFIKNEFDFSSFCGTSPSLRIRKTILCGESAGGHLIQLLGLTLLEDSPYDDTSLPKIDGIVDLYGVKDIVDELDILHDEVRETTMKFIMDFVVQDEKHVAQKKFSPYSILKDYKSHAHIRNYHCPPVLMIHGSYDNLVSVDDSIAYFNELKRYQARTHSKTRDALIIVNQHHHVFNLLDTIVSFQLHDTIEQFVENI